MPNTEEQEFTSIGDNVRINRTGDTLTIQCDLSQELGPSKTGKTILISKLGKAHDVGNGIYLGINIYKYLNKK